MAAVRIVGILLLLAYGLASANASAVPVRELAVLVDPAGTETFASASAPTASGRYVPLAGSLSAGYTRNAHWLRFTVAPPAAGEWWLEVQPPFLDDLRLYEPVAGGYVERRAGDRLPFASREVDYRAFVFKLALNDTAPRTYYLRLQTTSSSIAALQLWQPDQFRSAASLEYAAQGMYFGIFALVIFLNLIFWIWLRDALYGWFCLHMLANAFIYLNANGFVGQYLLPDAAPAADLLTSASALLLLPALSPFFRRILRVERNRPILYALFRLQVVLPCLLLPSLFFDFYTEAVRVVMLQGLLGQLLAFVIAYHRWREGRHEAPYILLAVVLTMLGGMTSILLLLGANIGDQFSFTIRQFTGVGNILAMHFALAIRIREMHREQQQAREHIRVAQAEFAREREAHEEQGRFIAMLSHELKTPLAVIDGAAQALERIDRSGDPEVARRHERIRRSVGRIDRLVEQFLTKDRLDAERIEVHRSEVDIVALLRQVADTSADGAERVRLTTPATLSLAADGALLRVAVANLLDNALKYSPYDSAVAVSAMPRDENGVAGIEIVVADDGPGIPPELHDQVFARYTRGTNVGHVSGAGLGLYLVRRIAELHGGKVELSPRPGGVVFRLWLPAAGEDAA